MNIDRYMVFAAPPADRPLDDHKEISSNSEFAAKLHCIAFVSDGYTVQLKDVLANQFIPYTKTKEVVH